MALTDANGLVMPVSPMYGNGNNGGGFGGDWAWIIVLLLIFGIGGWGNNGTGGGFGGGGLYPWMNQADITTSGFQNQMINSGIDGIQSGINSGFSDLQNALCSGFAGVNAGVANGFAQAEIAENARQMSNMNQLYGLQSSMQNCCCENRAGLADLKYTVATEACATRTSNTQDTQAVLNAVTSGVQSIKDQLCQDKIDAKNDEIAQLRQRLYMSDLAASQTAQTAQLTAGQNAAMNALVTELRSCPIPCQPVYGSQPIFTCSGNNGGCGCGGNF